MNGAGSRILKVAVFIAVFAAILYVFSFVCNIVKLVVIAAILAYILAPLTQYLESKGMGRAMATSIIFVFFLVIVILSFSWLIPHVIKEIKSVEVEVTAERATNIIRDVETGLKQRFAFLGLKNLDLIEKLQEIIGKAGNQVYSYFLNAMSLLSSLLIIPFVMFFLLKDWRDMKKYAVSLVPNRYFEFSLMLLHKTDQQLGGYLRGTFMDSLIIGILSIIALLVLKVKYAVLLGTFAGFANMVPFIGPIFGAIPAILVAMLGNEMIDAWYVAVAFLIVQAIDNAIVKPVVVARMVSLHPIVVLLAVIVGGKFFGILGMFLFVPVTAIIKVVIEESIRNFRKYRFSNV